jgi:FtsZ-interacting cell division protein ZipA
MNPLEIILIIIGIIIIIISCILVDRSDNQKEPAHGKELLTAEAITQEDRKVLLEKMKELLSEISEETVVSTDDTLSKLSNEKIIAVNDFSDQILEKIKRNHEEVVFLYNMLNDKEKELKAAVKEIDSSKKKVQDIMETKANTQVPQTAKNVKPQTAPKPASQDTLKDKIPQKAAAMQTEGTHDVPVINGLSSNNNTQILALYSQGKSVIEISRLLGLGQGEVKLVIDLFKGKK